MIFILGATNCDFLPQNQSFETLTFFSVFRIRIHFFRIRRLSLETNTDPDPIRIQGFNDQKLKKITAEKKIKFVLDQKLQFTYP
jgi:hypothetical protein